MDSAATTSTPTTPAVTARGRTGQITVDGDRILVRKGLLNRRSGVRGERLVSPRAIAAVRMEPPTDQSDGYLQLVMQGEDTAAEPTRNGEFTIRFTAASAPSFEQVHARLTTLLS